MSFVMLKDGRQVKLGRIRPKARPQCLDFGNYYNPANATVQPPASVDWSTKAMSAINRVYLNDQYGDCVIASKYHQVGIWSGNDTGTAIQGTDKEVYAAYQTICGPGDNGCVITEVLDYFKQNGLKFNGVTHKIDGYVSANWTNKTLVQVAINLFGSGCIGINLPSAWTCTNCVWDVTNTRSVGGHDVCLAGYNDQGVQICTWGGLVTITWAAFTSRNWIEELYFELSPDWYNNDNLAPNGIDVAALKSDLQIIGGGNIPPLPDPTTTYSLFEGPTMVGSTTGYTSLTAAEADGHTISNRDQAVISIKDNSGNIVEVIQPVPNPPPPPPVPTTGFTGAVRYAYTNGVISDITLFKPKK